MTNELEKRGMLEEAIERQQPDWLVTQAEEEHKKEVVIMKLKVKLSKLKKLDS